MMSWRLSQTVQRFAALTLLMLAGMLVWQVSGGVYVDHLVDMNKSIAETQGAIARFTRLSTQHDHLQASQETQRNNNTAANGLFKENDEGRAAAALQGRIKRIITDNGGKMVRLSTLPISQDPPYKRVSTKTEIDADTAALGAILSDVTEAVPLMFIENLHIRTASQSAAQQNTAQSLRITLSVYGYFAAGGAQ